LKWENSKLRDKQKFLSEFRVFLASQWVFDTDGRWIVPHVGLWGLLVNSLKLLYALLIANSLYI